MLSISKKIRVFIDDLFQVSKLVKTEKKKRKILLVAIVNNFLVFFDILIILYFAEFFSNRSNINLFFLNQILENEYLLPVAILLRFLCIYVEKVVSAKLQYDIEKNLKVELLNEIFNRGNITTSDAYFYVNELARSVSVFYATFAVFLGSFLQILAFTIYLVITNLNAVIVLGIGVALLFLPTLYLTKLGRRYAHISYLAYNEISEDVERVLDNVNLIKLSKKVKSEVLKFTKSLTTLYDSRLSDVKVGTINSAMPNFLTLFGISILLIFFGFIKFLTIDFIGILLRLFQALGILNKNIHLVSSFHVYLEKLYAISEAKEEVNYKNFVLALDKGKEDAVVFEDVSFQYFNSEEPILENINLNFLKNKHTIITGPNGSGKSTILGLATGILLPTVGKVTTSTKNYGYVSATPLIIKGTLRENLLYGNSLEIGDKEIMNMLNSFDLFKDRDDYNLDSVINNKSLSMGQMQKVSFIRALLGDKDILILDESTSNLDEEAKNIVSSILASSELTIINSTHSDIGQINYDHHYRIAISGEDRKVIKVK